jgi:Putative transposase
LKTLLATVFPEQDAMIGAVIAIQTFGDFRNFNPHCHVLWTDGTFFGSRPFKVAPALDTESLEKLFEHKVLKMLVRKGKITQEVVKLIMSWRHSGFNVHCGPRIQSGDEEAMENLARYIVPYRLFRLVRPGGSPSDNGFYVDPQYPSDLSV